MKLVFILILTILALNNQTLNAAESFDIYIENDSSKIGGPGTDNNYTNGIELSYVYSTKTKPFWSPIFNKFYSLIRHSNNDSTINFGITLGQKMYSPKDISESKLILDDRPYSGWSYLGLSSNLKVDEENLFLFSVNFGIIGPSSNAEFIQKNFHKLIGSTIPMGWSNQLKDEITLQLYFQHRYKYFSKRLFSQIDFDLIPFYQIAFGNVLVSGGIGTMVRFGINVSDDFGPTRPSAFESKALLLDRENEKKWKLYLFSSLMGQAVARSIFLDGNSFKSSHSIEKNNYLYQADLGVTLEKNIFSLSWSRVFISPEIANKKDNHAFASILFRIKKDI